MRHAAQQALKAYNQMMPERLDLHFPSRLALPMEMVRSHSQSRLTREKATLCRQIEKIQTSLDMTGKTPLQLSELLDTAFTFIAIKPGLKFANVSNRPSFCRFSRGHEKCGLHRKKGNDGLCLLEENGNFMPWACWHPHFFGDAPHKLLSRAAEHLIDNFHAPEIIESIRAASVFLNSLNAVAGDFSKPLIRVDILPVTNSGSNTAKTPDTTESQIVSSPIDEPDPAPRRRKFTKKWLLRAVFILLVEEYTRHHDNLEYRGLDGKDVYEATKGKRPYPKFPKKPGEKTDPVKVMKSGLSAVRKAIECLREILGESKMGWRIKSRNYRLDGEGDIESFKKYVFNRIDEL